MFNFAKVLTTFANQFKKIKGMEINRSVDIQYYTDTGELVIEVDHDTKTEYMFYVDISLEDLNNPRKAWRIIAKGLETMEERHAANLAQDKLDYEAYKKWVEMVEEAYKMNEEFDKSKKDKEYVSLSLSALVPKETVSDDFALIKGLYTSAYYQRYNEYPRTFTLGFITEHDEIDDDFVRQFLDIGLSEEEATAPMLTYKLCLQGWEGLEPEIIEVLHDNIMGFGDLVEELREEVEEGVTLFDRILEDDVFPFLDEIITPVDTTKFLSA